MTILEQAAQAKAASYSMMNLSSSLKDDALQKMADALEHNADYILEQNEKDLAKGRASGLSDALLDRLRLTKLRISAMAEGLRKIAALPDPLGAEDYVIKRPNGLAIGKRRVPLGVIGIIYEARPNVTSDAIGLCIKSSNAMLLRGGSEAINSNIAIADTVSKAAYEAGLPEGSIQFIRDTSREGAIELMRLNGYIDVLIPRGGQALIKSVVKNATVPVIETGIGNCHTYLDDSAAPDMAREIALNAKVSRPSVCNAMETLLVHEEFAKAHLKEIADALKEHGVAIRGCRRAKELLPEIDEATEEDWVCEYGDLILAVKVVSSLDEAIDHINKYGTKHSECIVTKDYEATERFLNEVDAAVVYVNASTRFTDGEEFGFGAEIGISTQKLHARGPMGLFELTSVKYVVRGNGQIR